MNPAPVAAWHRAPVLVVQGAGKKLPGQSLRAPRFSGVGSGPAFAVPFSDMLHDYAEHLTSSGVAAALARGRTG